MIRENDTKQKPKKKNEIINKTKKNKNKILKTIK